MLYLLDQEPTWTFYNNAKSGRTSRDIINNFTADVVDYNADYLLVMMGSNDIKLDVGYSTEIIANYTELYNLCHSGGRDIKLVVFPILPRYQFGPSDRVEKNLVNTWLNQTMDTWEDVYYCDIYYELAEPTLPDVFLNSSLSYDGIHLNDTGYQVWGTFVDTDNFPGITESTAESYNWNFGDGHTSSEINPTHIYDDAGTFTVSLTVTFENATTSTYTKTGYIYVASTIAPVISDFTGTPLTGNSPLSVSFSANILTGTVTQYYWIFGDGYTGYGAYHEHTYYQKGVYDVTLIVTGPGGTDTLTKTTYVNCTKPAYEILKKVEAGTSGYGEISEADYNELMNNTIGDNQSWEDLDLPGVMSAVMAPGPQNFGPFFWIIVFGAIGTFIYIKTDSVIIPGALFLIGSGLIGPMILPEFGNIIWGIVIVGFAGLGYILFKSR